MRASGALGQFPIVLEQILEEVIAPLGRGRGPDDFEAATNRVFADAGVEFALPAKALLLDGCTFGLGTDEFCIARTMRLAKGVAAGDESNRLFIIHRHASKSFPNVAR